ncbi:uncharacterized protein PV09_02306 [Verruconis gallopava]|uniref:FAD/NAD(P)-binding domain-containing protein n=1 Tax=Verruconis gallopava TaxID=253628 RepID=A0A0D2AJ72_9PEZI|nr:uncharacterized protein PV09_02306 [Verruconis gallopava]KIW06590.1 hypothetical protein PV09_02306 [Verruconis gallopava]
MLKPFRVCVVGGGPQGLAALKNLLELNGPDEQLFDVELLETRNCIGGKWAYTEDKSEITALPNTAQNTSRIRNHYSDFPVSDAWKRGGREGDIPMFLNQEETAFYLEQYAQHFGLLKYVRFGWKVTQLQRDGENQKWILNTLCPRLGESRTELYDKIIIATGQHHSPLVPQIEGTESFTGKTLHASEFKSKESFRGQAVLIVGSSNSAGDIASELAGTAKSVLLSHRRGVTVVPRIYQNRPIDVMMTRRIDTIMRAANSLAPAYMASISERLMKKMVSSAWKDRLRPEWGLNPETAPSIYFTPPMVSDSIIPLLEADAVKFVPGIQRVLEDGMIELQDGQRVRVDIIIYCTGYNIDSALTRPVERRGKLELPSLYHKIYHPEYPDSLAYLSFWHTVAGICELGDLASMGIAQVFAGRYQLPDLATMNHQIAQSHNFVNGLATRAPQPISLQAAAQCLDRGPFIGFLHKAAGTQVSEKLGYGLAGWKFWWKDREFCNLLMTGVDSIHTARLFDGRPGSRKKWEGARQAIIEANNELNRFEARLNEEQKARAT